jgi:hypothetical protein
MRLTDSSAKQDMEKRPVVAKTKVNPRRKEIGKASQGGKTLGAVINAPTCATAKGVSVLACRVG